MVKAITSIGGKHMSEETTKITDDLAADTRLRIKKLIVNHPECGFKKIRHFINAAVEEKLTALEA
jgi:hypothetical protein